ISFGLSAALIWRLADERTRLLSLAFFAWNPAVLIEGMLRLHNDLLTVPFVLGAVWLWRPQPARSRAAALVLATLGVLVKVTVAPLGLVLGIRLIADRDWRGLALGAVACAVVVAALYAPYWSGLSTFAPLFAQASRPQWSLGALLLTSSAPLIGSAATLVVRGVLGLVCVVLIAAVLIRPLALLPGAVSPRSEGAETMPVPD